MDYDNISAKDLVEKYGKIRFVKITGYYKYYFTHPLFILFQY